MIRTRLAVLLIALVAFLELGVFLAITQLRRPTPPPVLGPSPRVASDKAVMDQYMATHTLRKLQVGAGSNNLPDWLNTDIEPAAGQVYLDATQPLPFPDGSFRYVYGEQVIEHITFPQGLAFMKECYRILAPGGRIRLATPNLLSLISLFNAEKTPIQKKFMDFQTGLYHLSPIPRPETSVLNLMVREWGHQFIYDPASLRAALEAAGFRPVTQYAEQESDDPALRGIEMHWKGGGHELDQYTSQFMEGLRP